ncbi:major capsid protein [Bailinhaonella thermotolerans]|uniref:Major capsid protein n=1 Tax=Bailinhaonella thermotolerans TaxID=1070861 RepID=A0A3A4AGD0_9ACTN|nr:major capsid protein [Bailinhaonella thermotolerans]RJL19342.1 hypothetical protein D5H75_40475 [Bailinhaonella thermotolerans]
MSELLKRLLAAHSTEDQAARAEQVAAILAEAGDLADLQSAIISRFDEVRSGEQLDDAAVTELEQLAALASTVTDHQAATAQATADAAARVEAAAALLDAARPPAEPEAPAATSPGTGGDPAEAAPTPETAAPETQAPAETAPEPVMASGSGAAPVPGRRAAAPAVRLSSIPSSTLPARTAEQDRADRVAYTITAAAEIPGVPAGATMTWDQMCRAMADRMSAIAGRSTQPAHVSIARVQRQAPEPLTYRSDNDWDMWDKITNEKELAGGTLVAAGGWCAPSETLYDMCPTAGTDGMVDLPTVTTSRGGVRYADAPQFAAVYSSTGLGFHQTEAQAQTGTTKPCYTIACPTLTEVRLDVDGLCIRTPILTERGWPEMVSAFMDSALAAHAHKLNAWVLAKMAAESTHVTIPAPTGTAPVVDPHGPGAIGTVLSAVELQVTYIRYRHRLPDSTTIELVAPRWLRGILRADLAKKPGYNAINTTDAVLDEYLRGRGVAPQWVYDWQDAITGTPTEFGGATPPTAWPGTADVLIYPAGTFTRLQQDVIRLDGVYDHASLTENMVTSLFTEEGVAVMRRCFQAYRVTIPVCPNGAVGAGVAVACATP